MKPTKEESLATRAETFDVAESVLLKGDLAKLTPEERTAYYLQVCRSMGLNPATKPFEFIILNGRMVMYAGKGCAEQLRGIHKISITQLIREVTNECYVVTASARGFDGRTDESIGAVPIKGLAGEALSNAMMKAETKAKRRVTLSICGLGMLDESETDSIPGAKVVDPPMQIIGEEAAAETLDRSMTAKKSREVEAVPPPRKKLEDVVKIEDDDWEELEPDIPPQKLGPRQPEAAQPTPGERLVEEFRMEVQEAKSLNDLVKSYNDLMNAATRFKVLDRVHEVKKLQFQRLMRPDAEIKIPTAVPIHMYPEWFALKEVAYSSGYSAMKPLFYASLSAMRREGIENEWTSWAHELRKTAALSSQGNYPRSAS